MIHPPTLFDLYEHVVPIAVQALATCTAILLLVGLLVRRGVAREDGVVPSERLTLRNFMEIPLEAVIGLMQEVIGPTWRSYVPLIGTLGFFILISNLMGLVPGLTGPTSWIETNLAWAAISFATYNYVALRQHGWSYARHFVGPVWWLAPIMIPVELVSHGARLLSLTIRLTANMFADHTLVALFLSFGLGLGWILPWIFMGLGLFVAFLQAFIFAFLTTIYIGTALEEAH